MYRPLRHVVVSKSFVRNVSNSGQVLSSQPLAKRKEYDVSSSSELPPMPPCDITPFQYKGMNYDEMVHVRKANLGAGLVTYYRKPLLIHQGYKQWLFDHEGNRYLDMFAGIVTVSVGHCHPKPLEALKEQANRLWHTTSIYMHPGIQEYAHKLASKLPEPLKHVHFVNSGSDANDLALMLARLHTKKNDIISFRNGFHGTSPGMNGVTSLSSWKYRLPSESGKLQTMNPDVYRGPWGGSKCRDSPVQVDRPCSCGAGHCEASDRYIEQLNDVIIHSSPKNGVAGFFAEPIQGVGGTVQYPNGLIKKAYDLVRSHGGVCISDEVQTGFGRTGGDYWGFQMHGVIPDIVTMAKGIGNGFPIGAVVTTKEISSALGSALHFNTYGGNPLSCAVGSAVLDVIDEEHLQENSRQVGTHLLNSLAPLREEFTHVGDVRGKGLMIGVELVNDKATKSPLSPEDTMDVHEQLRDLGILVGKGGLYGTTIRLKPPMCVTKEDADYTVAAFRKTMMDLEKRKKTKQLKQN